MASAKAFNRTIAPLVVDKSGRLLDGKAEGKVDPDFQPVKDALAAGTLVLREAKSSSSKKTASSSKETASSDSDKDKD